MHSTGDKLKADARISEPEEIMSADRIETHERRTRRGVTDESLEAGVRQNLLIALGVAVSMLLVVVAGSLLTS
jgi:hypothetical protein